VTIVQVTFSPKLNIMPIRSASDHS